MERRDNRGIREEHCWAMKREEEGDVQWGYTTGEGNAFLQMVKITKSKKNHKFKVIYFTVVKP